MLRHPNDLLPKTNHDLLSPMVSLYPPQCLINKNHTIHIFCPLSLSKIIMRFIHAVACINSLFFFFFIIEYYSIEMNIPQLVICSPVDECLGCFQLLAITSKATMNIFESAFTGTYAFITYSRNKSFVGHMFCKYFLPVWLVLLLV